MTVSANDRVSSFSSGKTTPLPKINSLSSLLASVNIHTHRRRRNRVVEGVVDYDNEADFYRRKWARKALKIAETKKNDAFLSATWMILRLFWTGPTFRLRMDGIRDFVIHEDQLKRVKKSIVWNDRVFITEQHNIKINHLS